MFFFLFVYHFRFYMVYHAMEIKTVYLVLLFSLGSILQIGCYALFTHETFFSKIAASELTFLELSKEMLFPLSLFEEINIQKTDT